MQQNIGYKIEVIFQTWTISFQIICNYISSHITKIDFYSRKHTIFSYFKNRGGYVSFCINILLFVKFPNYPHLMSIKSICMCQYFNHLYVYNTC